MNHRHQKQCFATSASAWRFTDVYSARYQSSRCYTRFARELLKLFAVHRIATAGQVFRFLPDLFKSDRSARMHLQTLAVSGELAVVRSRGMGAVNLYLITRRGLRAVADGDGLTTVSRRHPSGTHLGHDLIGTELFLKFVESSRRIPGMSIAWSERFAFHRYPCFQTVIPDGALLIKHPQGQLVYFAEVSSGEDSTTRLSEKLSSYELWTETDESKQFLIELYREHGAIQPRPQFRLLFVLHHRLGLSSDVRLRQLLYSAAEVSPAMRRRMWCTTTDFLASTPAMTSPIWLRLSDLEAAYEAATTNRSREFRRHLSQLLQSTCRYHLFQNDGKT